MTSSLLTSLDPQLVDFWSGFPCPPPWNEALLFRLNWTACVSQSVGEHIKWYLADRCHIPLPGLPSGAGTGSEVNGEQEVTRISCDVTCKVLVAVFSCLFVVAVVVGACFAWRRRRRTKKGHRGCQPSAVAAGERTRGHYPGIHYASAAVVNSDGERPLPPCPDGEVSTLPQELHSYVYEPSHKDDNDGGRQQRYAPQHPQRGFHLQLCPNNRRAAYRAVSTFCPDGEDLPHQYEYISDTDSVMYRGGSLAEDEPLHDYSYCTCEARDPSGREPVEYDPRLMPAGGTLWGRYPYGQSVDSSRLHEISRPYPTYPADAHFAAGGHPFVGGGAWNGPHPDGRATDLGVGEGRFDLPGQDLTVPGEAFHTRGQARVPEDGRMFLGDPRGHPHQTQAVPGHWPPCNASLDPTRANRDVWEQEDSNYKSVRPSAPLFTAEGQCEEYPSFGLDGTGQRTAALTLGPYYVTDRLEGDTSTV